MNSRACSNPEDANSAGPMPASTEGVTFSLSGGQALLIHQALNELLHGIRGVRAFSQVGISKLALKGIFVLLNEWIAAQKKDANGLPVATFERTYSVAQLRALRNTVELVMLDLGRDEFRTRTGFSLMEAGELLNRFNAAFLDPLRLDQPTSRVSQ